MVRVQMYFRVIFALSNIPDQYALWEGMGRKRLSKSCYLINKEWLMLRS